MSVFWLPILEKLLFEWDHFRSKKSLSFYISVLLFFLFFNIAFIYWTSQCTVTQPVRTPYEFLSFLNKSVGSELINLFPKSSRNIENWLRFFGLMWILFLKINVNEKSRSKVTLILVLRRIPQKSTIPLVKSKRCNRTANLLNKLLVNYIFHNT